MKIHALLHTDYEDIGAVAIWAEHHNHEIERTRLYEGDALPELDDFDILIIMGGPMSVNDEDKYTWLADEKRFIENAVENNKFIVGICLGAQLIASAMGAAVYKNSYKEIGWFPVKKSLWLTNPTADYLPFFFTTFHWHGEVFDIPDGAVRIMQSEACENQAFIYEDNVAAFQYHMELTPKDLELLIERGGKELDGSKYVQSKDEILSHIINCGENNLYLFRVLDYFSFKFHKSEQKN